MSLRPLLLFVLPMVACGHATQAVPADRQSAYFRCETNLEDAERNLVSSGFPLANQGAASLLSVEVEVALSDERAQTAYVEDILGERKSRWIFRESIPTVVSAVSKDSGLEFQLYRRFLEGMNAKRERVEWISEEALGHAPTRAYFNRVRKCVCGGDDFFGPNEFPPVEGRKRL